MARASKCDRCGELSEGEPISTIDVENSSQTIWKLGNPCPIGEYDLCEHCSQSFQEWIDPSDTDD